MREWTEIILEGDLTIRVTAGEGGICTIDLNAEEPAAGRRNDGHPQLAEAARQLRAYFAGELREFRLALDLRGTGFQKRVWRELTAIPYGETRSYGEIASAIGAPRAVRAVGAANGANPAPIVVPCHRVIGAGGKLTGYGGGLPLKKKLLDLEREALRCSRA